MRKKIVLINPSVYDTLPMTQARNLPYGLMKIGGHLIEQGHDVRLIQAYTYQVEIDRGEYLKCGNYENEGVKREVIHLGKSKEAIKKDLKDIGRPDEIWVSSTMTYYWRGVHEAIEAAKEIYPDVPVILGGIYASICYDHASTSKADKIHKGPYLPAEQSRTALELLDQMPDYFIIKYTRGCPHKCSYCAVTDLEGHKMIFMDNDKFVEELEEKYNVFGIKRFHLWESNLLIDARNRFEKVLDKIIEKRLPVNISFPEGLQPSLVYPELAWKMRKAGVTSFALPLESSDESLYERFHKPSTLKQFDRCVKIFQDVGFKPKQMKIFILVGMPEQTIESIVMSNFKVLCMRCRATNLRFTPIPGTEEYEKHKDFLKDKSLEELNPVLYPFASPKMTVKDLDLIVDFINSKANIYQIVTIKNGTVKDNFQKLIRTHLFSKKDFGPDNPHQIQIINNHTTFTTEQELREILETSWKMKDDTKYAQFFKPEPPCKFKNIKGNLRKKTLIPTRCDQCLKLFAEGCLLQPLNRVTEEDVKETYKLQQKNIKEECKRCNHYIRGYCRVLCEQIK